MKLIRSFFVPKHNEILYVRPVSEQDVYPSDVPDLIFFEPEMNDEVEFVKLDDLIAIESASIPLERKSPATCFSLYLFPRFQNQYITLKLGSHIEKGILACAKANKLTVTQIITRPTFIRWSVIGIEESTKEAALVCFKTYLDKFLPPLDGVHSFWTDEWVAVPDAQKFTPSELVAVIARCQLVGK